VGLILLASAACSGDSEAAPADGLEGTSSAAALRAPRDPGAFVSADSARLLDDLAWLSDDAREGRGFGTPGNAAAREYLVRAMDESAIDAPASGRLQAFPIRIRGADQGEGVNVLGVIEGSEHPDRYIVLTAHFDHEGVRDGEIYNGADDNASGTAAVMSMARYLMEHRPAHSVLIGLVDAEEVGLQGARALVESGPVAVDRMVLNVNLDMVSRNDSVLFAAGTAHTPSLRAPLEEVAAGAGVVLRFGHDRADGSAGDDWTFSSDHGPFHRAGVPFVYFGVEDHDDYHRPTDDFEKVDPGFYVRSVTTILEALLALDRSLSDA
jgi:Zn-dependent M28 family amino/carboxypeptidase